MTQLKIDLNSQYIYQEKSRHTQPGLLEDANLLSNANIIIKTLFGPRAAHCSHHCPKACGERGPQRGVTKEKGCTPHSGTESIIHPSL